MRIPSYIFALLLLSLTACNRSASDKASANAGQLRERMNRIFYWQMADELGLNPVAEKDMAMIIENIQKRRETALLERDAAMEALKALATDAKVAITQAPLDRYQKALAELSTLDDEEFRRLKIAVGVDKLARFYVVREQILEKLRGALKNGENSKK